MAETFELKGKYELDASGAITTLTKLGEEADKTEKKFQGLSTGGTIAMIGFGAAVGLVTKELFDVGKAGANLDRLQVSTYVLGQNMGLTKNQIDSMVNALENTNTFGTNAWSAINTLTRSGLLPFISTLKRLDPVTNTTKTGFDAFILSIKDLGAAAGVSSSDAIRMVTTAIDQMSPAMLQTLNVTGGLRTAFDDFARQNNILGRELTNTEKKQAMLNFIMKEGEKVAGTYEATYETAGKNLLSIQDALKSTTEIVGQSIQPIMKGITGSVLNAIKSFRDWSKENQKAIVFTVTFIGTLIVLTTVVGGLYKAYMIAAAGVEILRAKTMLATLSMGLLGVAIVGISLLVARNFAKQVQNTKSATDATADLADALKDMGGSGGEALDNINGKAAEAQQRLRDIQQQIADENREFNKQLASIIDGRRENLANNKKTLEQEQRDFNRKQEEMAKKYREKSEDMRRSNESRLKDLETSLAATLIVGSDSYNEDVANYQAALEEEKLAHEERVKEAEQQYKQETEDAKAEYDERTQALRLKIKQDEDFLKKHAEIAKTINREILEDEIEELVRTHKRRLEELNNQLQKEKSAYNKHFGGVGSSFGDLMDNMNKEKLNWDKILAPMDFKQVLKGVKQDVITGTKFLTASIAIAVVEIIGSAVIFLKRELEKLPLLKKLMAKTIGSADQSQGLKDSIISMLDKWGNVTGLSMELGFANGGYKLSPGQVMVGERGPELVNLPVGSRITDAASTNRQVATAGTNRQTNIYNNNNFYYTEDLNVFNQKLAYQLKGL